MWQSLRIIRASQVMIDWFWVNQSHDINFFKVHNGNLKRLVGVAAWVGWFAFRLPTLPLKNAISCDRSTQNQSIRAYPIRINTDCNQDDEKNIKCVLFRQQIRSQYFKNEVRLFRFSHRVLVCRCEDIFRSFTPSHIRKIWPGLIPVKFST